MHSWFCPFVQSGGLDAFLRHLQSTPNPNLDRLKKSNALSRWTCDLIEENIKIK
jgi:hypothetical protein